MFMTPAGLLAILLIHCLIGTAIAFIVVVTVRRKRPGLRLLWFPSLVSVVFWLLTLHEIDLKGCDSYWENGKRVALPWCADQNWRIVVAAHPYWVSLSIAAIASLAAMFVQMRMFHKEVL